MSYAMLSLANNSKEALLDPDVYMRLANLTFGVFFKHFISENVSSALGGSAYQPIGEKLPWSLGYVPNDTISDVGIAADQGAVAIQNHTRQTLLSANAKVEIPVEQLVMSPLAVILCLSLLAFLFLVTIVMYSINRNQYKVLPRDVNTLASTLGWVYASDRLLAWVQTVPIAEPWYRTMFKKTPETQGTHQMVRMGPFTDSSGTERWGIELVDKQTSSLVYAEEVAASSVENWIEMRTTQPLISNDNSDLGVRERLLSDGESDRSSTSESEQESRENQPEQTYHQLEHLDSQRDAGLSTNHTEERSENTSIDTLHDERYSG